LARFDSYRVWQKISSWRANWRLIEMTRKVAGRSHPRPDRPTIAFFNASSRLTGMSQNAAFSYLTACGLQLAGVPVVNFVCQAGMSRCVQGTDRQDFTKPPPCKGCIAQSRRLLSHAPTIPFHYEPDLRLARAIESLSVEQLSRFEWRVSDMFTQALPLGALVLPSLRWALRRHHLPGDEPVAVLFREYIQSAQRVAQAFGDFLEQVDPAAVVLFNGIMFPEATARWLALSRSVRVITHEVGFLPFSAFFTDGQATAYPIDIPDEFELSPAQEQRLDAYLERRFQGQFSMAGIRFWPEMRGLDQAFLERARGFRQIVPVFTNVVYDTSQVHANVIFPHMFAWLDLVLDIIRSHPETLFVIRAHPDEMRPGTRKQSRESVQDWIARHQVARLPNVVFVNSQEYISSYELIQRARFVMVYNSSIGLEASLMGSLVLCAGRARYTQYPTVVFPHSIPAFRQQAEDFLAAEGALNVPQVYRRNARRFLYYQLYRASLPFGDFIENYPRPGFVQLRSFSWQQLSPERSLTLRVLADGIFNGAPFLMPEDQPIP
jgi:hypothetical protein